MKTSSYTKKFPPSTFGVAKDEHPLQLMVDTGASHSLVDQQVAKKLGLKSYGMTRKVNSFGYEQRITQRVSLPRLGMGPILVTLPCFVVDLSPYGVDGILGMDLLSRADFSIDFVRKQIHFGSRDPLPAQAPLHKSGFGVVVTLDLDNHEAKLFLDSATNGLFLYGARVRKWIKRYAVQKRGYVDCLEGKVPVDFINLRNIRMGESNWGHRHAAVLPTRNSTTADGTLGLVYW